MEWKLQLFLLVVIGTCQSYNQQDYSSGHDPYRHQVVLDTQGKYILDWVVDNQAQRVYFNVTVQTRGYVGFGLSMKGLMDGADIVIGGVRPDGSWYFSDRHGTKNHEAELDLHQDWILHSARESYSQTFLSFSRPFETCDEDDLPINIDSLVLLWAIGERDNEKEFHHQNRGTFRNYLLDPNFTPRVIRASEYRNITRPRTFRQVGEFKVWGIPFDLEVPAVETAYVCTFHRPPVLHSKQHIAGFRIVTGEAEKRHVHHFTVHRCHAPRGISPYEMFDKYVGLAGDICYNLFLAQHQRPVQYCQELMIGWGRGDPGRFFPNHVGIPLGESPDEYYMVQTHYDNPQELSGVRLQYTIESFYTSNLRKHDVGMLITGHNERGSPSIVVPAGETNHVVYGHCSSECTKKIIPPEGIYFLSGNLHSHVTGTTMRTMHIRNGKESAVLADDNFEPSYQPIRFRREELKILPGDMIYARCTYDTTNLTRPVVGGYSTSDEMCANFYYYYPKFVKDNYGPCIGEIRSKVYRDLLGITEYTMSHVEREEVVTSPSENAGLTVAEVASRIPWNIDKRRQLQAHHRFLPQVTLCYSWSPEAVTRQLRIQIQDQSFSFLRDYLIHGEAKNYDPVTLTNVDSEVKDPENEFVSVWPKIVEEYVPPTICHRQKSNFDNWSH